MEDKRKHLEMIQAIINRIANNSFMLKGWCVTVLSAFIALAAAKGINKKYALIGYYPLIMFWLLDGYFLWQERCFRDLYDKVRKVEGVATDFSMDATRGSESGGWLKSMLSVTLGVFYGITMVIVLLIVIFIL